MKKTITLFAFALSLSGMAQTQLDTVTVTESRLGEKFRESNRQVDLITREEIDATPSFTVNELLQTASGVDVRTRGFLDIQSDISIRGGTYDQNLILLNGFNMNDPQTGHHNMNLPLVPQLIEKIEILQGGAASVYGPNAFSGAINIITRKQPYTQVGMRSLMGMHGLWQTGAHAVLNQGNHNTLISWDRGASSGFAPNTDFDRHNVFFQHQTQFQNFELLVNAGHNKKAFGANSFYSFRYPHQFEETRSRFAGARVTYHGPVKVELHGYVRAHNDRFELFRESEGFYRYSDGVFIRGEADTAKFVPNNFEAWNYYRGHNYHQTISSGAGINLSKDWKGLGATSVGMDIRNEFIQSNLLGDVTGDTVAVRGEARGAYLRQRSRTNLSVFFLHRLGHKRFSINAGLLANHNTDFGNDLLPSIDMGFRVTDHLWAFANANRSFRFPTYTDLYYNLGGAVGSLNLQPEYADNFEVGARHFYKGINTTVAAFRRNGQNLIDWVRFDGEDEVRAANITRVNLNGVDANVRMSKSLLQRAGLPLRFITLNYNYMWGAEAQDGFTSLYALDYLRHKLAFFTAIDLTQNLMISGRFTYQHRNGAFINHQTQLEEPYRPFTLVDVRLVYHRQNWQVFAEASNLFNAQYADLGSLYQPGIWLRAGFSFDFVFSEKKAE